ncbi:adenylyl-sulfate kinase [Blastopirellula retiformator]|uniref:adenylyl-sulfate kinase n=1 Tax=Blastopirellula retiformator TaxID=2527970 RepID=UPI001C981EBF|nr:adenylyl-sulfate kinase [Blastopirellula retiformator]
MTSTRTLLRFITCGSVDDGKSTLIGRLLLDCGAVFDDQIESLRSESKRFGSTSEDIDPALLVDGLEDERAQGITIDIAYRYFQTSQRKFIIADCPGHEQYTRNMATAASKAEAAVLVVDARKGLLTQTRRHAAIASLMGVRKLILAINKMDLVGCDQKVFDGIREQFEAAISKLTGASIIAIPVSGLRGDNVVKSSQNMPWYDGVTLLQALEECPANSERNDAPLRFAVQRVTRPDSEFRGYSGSVFSGTLRVGDAVQVVPGGQMSRVRSIVTFLGQQTAAVEGEAVTLTLEDEIDISRGDWLVHPTSPPQVSHYFDAHLIWMSQEALAPGKSYWLKQSTLRTSAEVEDVFSRLDFNTSESIPVNTLQLNDIGRCRIHAHRPIPYDPYCENRKTGSFILVDRVSHETVAGGLILPSEGDSFASGADKRRRNGQGLTLTASRVSQVSRRRRSGHDVATVLLSGLSGSGKTTIAYELEQRLFSKGMGVAVLDGENLRFGICRDLGFSAEERSENLRRAAEIARILNDAGVVCLAAFVAPEERTRSQAKELIGPQRFLHVHLKSTVETCRQRDSSGRYAAAERGVIRNFPGVTSPYLEPTDADLIVPTDVWTWEQCVDEIERWILARIDVT